MNIFDTVPPVNREKVLRLARKQLYEDNKRFPKDAFADIPEMQWPIGFKANGGTGCFRSRDFLVQRFQEHAGPGAVIRLSINRTEIDNNGDYKADISWEELQWIKNVLGYHASDAVEIYPIQKDVVNVANMRHLWILPLPLAFAWRSK